jgi:hypothetical protein
VSIEQNSLKDLMYWCLKDSVLGPGRRTSLSHRLFNKNSSGELGVGGTHLCVVQVILEAKVGDQL